MIDYVIARNVSVFAKKICRKSGLLQYMTAPAQTFLHKCLKFNRKAKQIALNASIKRPTENCRKKDAEEIIPHLDF